MGKQILRARTLRTAALILLYAAPLQQYGKGAQDGLRKSQRCECNSFLPELRQGNLRNVRSECGSGADSLRTVRDAMAESAAALRRASHGRAQPDRGGGAGTDSRRGRDVQRP